MKIKIYFIKWKRGLKMGTKIIQLLEKIVSILEKILYFLSLKQRNKNNQNIKKVNINTANLQELIAVKGIGEYRAQQIIKYRPYSSINELKKIRGINDYVLKKLEKYLTI